MLKISIIIDIFAKSQCHTNLCTTFADLCAKSTFWVGLILFFSIICALQLDPLENDTLGKCEPNLQTARLILSSNLNASQMSYIELSSQRDLIASVLQTECKLRDRLSRLAAENSIALSVAHVSDAARPLNLW
jgi:hypothetical protein